MEAKVEANADYMAAHLRRFGWQYIVVDIQWYEPTAVSRNYHPYAQLTINGYGRRLPAVNRFPSAAGGAGFAPLASYCRRLGLKFGIHILQGIPRQAVQARTPVLGAHVTAADIADTSSTCAWNTDMYGADAAKPGAQQYYDSLFHLYRSWGVDFVKVDDLSRPYHEPEIDLIHSSIKRIAPRTVFSASPGATPRSEAVYQFAREHVAHGRRLMDDWPELRAMFDLCALWQGMDGPGH